MLVWTEKYTDSNESALVWTGPKLISLLFLCFTSQLMRVLVSVLFRISFPYSCIQIWPTAYFVRVLFAVTTSHYRV